MYHNNDLDNDDESLLAPIIPLTVDELISQHVHHGMDPQSGPGSDPLMSSASNTASFCVVGSSQFHDAEEDSWRPSRQPFTGLNPLQTSGSSVDSVDTGGGDADGSSSYPKFEILVNFLAGLARSLGVIRSSDTCKQQMVRIPSIGNLAAAARERRASSALAHSSSQCDSMSYRVPWRRKGLDSQCQLGTQ